MTWMTKQLIVLVVSIAIMAGVTGLMPCVAESAQDTSQNAQKTLASVETITVNGDGDKAELVIKLSAPATYTSYKTTSPLRLIIDLSQTTQGTISAPVELSKGNFKNVVVSRFDTDAGVLTRLDIELVKDADAILSVSQAKPGEIRVSFPSLAAQAAVANTSSAAAQSTPVTSAKVDTLSPPLVAPVSERSSMPDDIKESTDVSLRTLTAVSVKDYAIILAIDGGADEFKTFRLNKPERFVVDLFNVKSALTSRITSINSLGVSSARLGVYPNKVRIVFDTMNGTFPEAIAAKSADGVTISLKSSSSKEKPNFPLVAAPKKEVLPEPTKQIEPSAKEVPLSKPITETPLVVAKPASREDVAKATARSGSASVEMIDFQVIDGISRVSVKVTGDVLVDAPIKTPGFVTLTIKNAFLPKKLQRSLEAKGFISPVLRVTPLLVKSRKGTDTKIRVAMRKSVPFEYRQEGDMFFIDFKNPEGMTADRVYSDIQNLRPPTVRSTKESSNKDGELGSALTSQAEPTVKPLGSSKLYKGRKVTLEFADAEVRKIFQLLSEVSNKNFVLGDDVTGSISIKLVNVPWDQALDIILDAKGLDKREDGNIIIIKGKGKFKSQAEEDQELKRAKLKATELETQMFNINYANLDDIVTQFKSMMTEGVGASVNKDTRTNKIIVKDIPLVIRSMRDLLKELDVPEKQVMIEARIVEATSTFTRSLGVNWGIHYRDGTASFMGINQLDTSFGGLATAAPTSGASGTPGGSMGISFGTLANNISIDLRLNAAASAGLIKIISAPKVATLNNKTAKIAQGQQVPYQSTSMEKGTETKFIEAALALEVTPHINTNGTISMKIDAKNDSVGDVPQGANAPSINKKQATTEMLLRDGETTVIGGIFVDSDNDSDAGVPYLMDIPLLGKLFMSNQRTKTKTELLIFITPRIISSF